MTPATLRAQCERQIELAGEGTIIVLILRGHANTDTARLGHQAGAPKGRVYGPAEEGRMIVGFKARAVLDWLKKNEHRIVVPERGHAPEAGAAGR